MIVIVVSVLFPIALGFPAMFSRVPPLVMLIPTTIPFGIQIPTPFLSLVAVFAMLLDRPVQACFRLFNRMLALTSIVVGVRLRCCCKKQKRARHQCCRCCLSKSSIQDVLLSVSLAAIVCRHIRLELSRFYELSCLLFDTVDSVLTLKSASTR
jgi:hypothetical protein